MVIVADTEPIRGLGIRLTGQGRVIIPSLGLDLIANGLTPAEAKGCALLLAHADLLDDGWREYVDAAGAIRDELVLPRDTGHDSEPGATVVSATDAEVLDVAATTTDDLQQLAPHVPDKVRAAVEHSDPDLDADLAAWAAGTRPHLRLLGPIQARTGTTGKPTAVAKRRAFYTELLAFLALHPQGVTIDQVVDAFGSDATQMRVHLSKVRSWLGVDPTTGGNYLPDATKSPAGIARGTERSSASCSSACRRSPRWRFTSCSRSPTRAAPPGPPCARGSPPPVASAASSPDARPAAALPLRPTRPDAPRARTEPRATTIGRFAAGMGPVGQAFSTGIGVMAAVGGTAAAMGADQTNQMGVGHNNFPPDYSRRGVRAGSGQSGYDGATDDPANADDATVANGYDGGGWGGPPPDAGTGGSWPGTSTPPPTGTPAPTAAQGGTAAKGAVSTSEVAEVAQVAAL